ncbi:SLC13 family permease [Nesterenkonia aurantiaca]|uniref:SLC13 family permease n=1 Tax=Nesterenkonia aurantiaca TaxID=1436010 RepID=UPI003EE6BBC4
MWAWCWARRYFALFYFVPVITGLHDAPRAVLAVTLWVASWWITKALPTPATSLPPLFPLPMTGGTDEETAAMAYANLIVFMYMGGFTIAFAIQQWNLHRRIAMTIIRMVGTKGTRLMLGVILATAGLSMWISNAATAFPARLPSRDLTRLRPGPAAGAGSDVLRGEDGAGHLRVRRREVDDRRIHPGGKGGPRSRTRRSP